MAVSPTASATPDGPCHDAADAIRGVAGPEGHALRAALGRVGPAVVGVKTAATIPGVRPVPGPA